MTNYVGMLEDLRALEEYRDGKILTGIDYEFDTWGRHMGGHDPAEQNWCGTAACMLGIIAADKRTGYDVRWFRAYSNEPVDPKSLSKDYSMYMGIGYGTHKAHTDKNQDAAAEKWDIIGNTSDCIFPHRLFRQGYYGQSLEDGIDAMRKWLNGHGVVIPADWSAWDGKTVEMRQPAT